jgi:hypothetical protein
MSSATGLDILNCKFDRGTLTVGEKITLTCPLPTDDSAPLHFIDTSGTPFVIKFLNEPSVNAGLVTQQVTSYKVGANELSALKLAIGEKEYSIAKLTMQVQSVLPSQGSQQAPAQGADQPTGESATAQPTPFPIYDPVAVAAPWWWWALWGVLLTIIVSFITYHFLKWQNERARFRKQVAIEDLQTPAEKFRSRLRKLESQGFHLRGEYKSFALELTQILKTGLSDQLKFQAEDLTSEEISTTLEKRYKPFFKLSGPQVTSVLANLDQIKFAKVETTSENCMSLIDMTMKIGSALFEAAP